VKKQSPSWPFLPIDPSVENQDCTQVITDPTEFQKCTEAKMPKRDPDANAIATRCAANEPTSSENGNDANRLASDMKLSVFIAIAGICLAVN
jgi:hypothetical protein